MEDNNPVINQLEILAEGFENSARPVVLVKVPAAYRIFKELIVYNAVQQLLEFTRHQAIKSHEQFTTLVPSKPVLSSWINAGGQLVLRTALDKLIKQIHAGRVKGWNDIHAFYGQQAQSYPQEKLFHALAALKEVTGINLKKAGPAALKNLVQQSILTKEWMVKGIYESRAKDYRNPFRKMVYQTTEEMNKVVGKLTDNTFIKQEQAALESYKKDVQQLIKSGS
ncbi:DUF4954 family protein [Paraflavitalea speifideaquila]|uniref:DUF6819 domain-containing protein n=1 Tax=Paraflavitalea speifideaquila TaxID=3076558 RepID=UPI0028E7FF51|nr:DUF4954 family protein [Paraflavitalea speifideiaquila]